MRSPDEDTKPAQASRAILSARAELSAIEANLRDLRRRAVECAAALAAAGGEVVATCPEFGTPYSVEAWIAGLASDGPAGEYGVSGGIDCALAAVERALAADAPAEILGVAAEARTDLEARNVLRWRR